MSHEIPACLASKPGQINAAEHVKSLLDVQRQTTLHLLADLRYLLLKQSHVALNSQLRDIYRRLRQVDLALEFYRRAETRIETLISHLGGCL
jgi:hypothetical protein